jgi:D-cysteine desulfhydrase
VNPKSFSQSSRLGSGTADGEIPLFRRFPALSRIPRAELCTLPSPVEQIPGDGNRWIKREDLNAPVCAGNKVRALEFLLGGLEPGDTVVTTGGKGSTHVLATIAHAARLGVNVVARRWVHDMNPTADEVALQIEAVSHSRVSSNPLVALTQARINSMRRRHRYIPVGGTSSIGILGHINAALELADQIENGEMPTPSTIVLPLGSGGTCAGMILGLRIAGLSSIEVVGARVGPRLFANERRVRSLARNTARMIERLTGENPVTAAGPRLRVVHHVYGGAYGRPLQRSRAAAKVLHEALSLRLDETYSAKAWTAAMDEPFAAGPVLFWLTFDPKCLTS